MRGVRRELPRRNRCIRRRLPQVLLGLPCQAHAGRRREGMMHKRRWCRSVVESQELLASMLTERTWTLCSAFSVKGHEEYVFVNDSTSEDGAAEFAPVKRLPDGTYVQVESITFG